MATLFLWSWLFSAKVNCWWNSRMDSLVVPLWAWRPRVCQNIFTTAVVKLFTSKQSALCKWNLHKPPLGSSSLAARLAESTVFKSRFFGFLLPAVLFLFIISSLSIHWSTYDWQVLPLISALAGQRNNKSAFRTRWLRDGSGFRLMGFDSDLPLATRTWTSYINSLCLSMSVKWGDDNSIYFLR